MADTKQAEKDYIAGMKYKDIASKYNVSINTVKSWKTRYKWNKKGMHTKQKSTHTKKEKVCTQKKDALQDIKEPNIEEIKDMSDGLKLTDKQRLFCFYYSRCLNATKAYQKAYGCTYIEAARHSYELRKNGDVNKLIDLYMSHEIDKERLRKSVVQKYIDIAFSDMNDYMKYGHKKVPVIDKETGEQKLDVDGNPQYFIDNYVILNDSKEVDGTLVTEVSEGKDGIKLKLTDKTRAMDWLGKHIDLLTTEQKERFDIEKAKVKHEDNEQSDNVLKEMLEGLKDE